MNDEFIILCYRNNDDPKTQGCIKTTNGIEFDFERNYKLKADYNHHARMTTFNGQAVLVGIVVPNYNKQYAIKANKFVEIFDSDENKWSLKWPNDTNVAFITQFALVPLTNKLLHIGGNDIGSSGIEFGLSSFYLDSMYTKWTKMGMG